MGTNSEIRVTFSQEDEEEKETEKEKDEILALIYSK